MIAVDVSVDATELKNNSMRQKTEVSKGFARCQRGKTDFTWPGYEGLHHNPAAAHCMKRQNLLT